jgi:hypothetical protein
MDARSELLAYMGAATVTIVLLFGLQIWYATYLDTHVVNVHPADAPGDAKLAARRERDQAKLSGGKLPIARAKAELAQRGRSAFPSIAPKPSTDLSAMAGWMHQPGFKPYVPRAVTAAPAAPTEAAPGEAPGEAPVEAPAPAAAAAAPTQRPAAAKRIAPPAAQRVPAAPPAAGQP